MGWQRNWIVTVSYTESGSDHCEDLPVTTTSACDARSRALAVVKNLHQNAVDHRIVCVMCEGSA